MILVSSLASSMQNSLGPAFVAAITAELDALIGPGRVDEQDFEALEQALRHQVLEITAQVMA